jgi:hypothetical protein
MNSRRLWRGFACLLVLVLLVGPVAAQAPAEPYELDGSTLTVFLVTMGPGQAVWERFSHNAIWVRDTVSGIDRLYNYGMFSFRQENFLKRFIRGEMDYWMQGFNGERHLQQYVAVDRSIWLQELSLTAEQRAELYAFLEWNERPENRFYRYDYYLDNCSTRVRDALDRVLGGRLYRLTGSEETGKTFRDHTRRLLAPDLAAYVGTLYSLGQPIDRPISTWEAMFLPVVMMERLRDVTVFDAEGNEVPLVTREVTLFESSGPAERQSHPVWWPGFLAVGLGIAALMLAATRSKSNAVATTLPTAWALVLGIGGAFIVGVVSFTQHWAAYWNENLFFFNPVGLALVVLIPIAAAGGRRAGKWASGLTVFAAAVSLLGFVVQLLPWFDQVNGEIIAAMLPPNLALAYVVVNRLASEPNKDTQ